MTQIEGDKLTKSGPGRRSKASHVIRDEAPHDQALPGLQSLLSPEHMSAHLATHLGRPVESIEACEISYVRYKPGTNCLVAYRITTVDDPNVMLCYAKVHTEENFDRAKLKLESRRWVQAPGVPEALVLNKERAILYFFPNDRLLDGLRVLSDTKKMQRLLYDWYDTYPESAWRISDRRMQITAVRYKPERRAVLRCETRATHRENGNREPVTVYVRIYSDDRGETNFDLMKTLYKQTTENSGLRLPRPLGYLPDRFLLMMEGLPGVAFRDVQAAFKGEILFSRIGSALAAFHTLAAPQLNKLSVEEIAAEAFSGAWSLEELIPELAPSISDVQTRLTEQRPVDSGERVGLVHGDFHQGQVVISDDHIGIIDFDRSYIGDQYADLGELCAHLHLLELLGKIRSHQSAEAAFLSGYEIAAGVSLDRARLKYWTTLRLSALAVSPFRRLKQHWRSKVQDIVRECSRLLSEK